MSAPPSLAEILKPFFPSLKFPISSDPDLVEVSHSIFPDTTYTENEKVDIRQWAASSSHFSGPNEDEAKQTGRLGSLNTHLSAHTTIIGAKPSAADVLVYARLAPLVKQWTAEERTGERGHHHITRYIDFVERAPLLGLSIEETRRVGIDPSYALYVPKPVNVKEEKERKKKDKMVAKAEGATPLVTGLAKNAKAPDTAMSPSISTDSAAPTPKKEKKEKAPKQPKQPATKDTPLSPALIDLRVGQILKAETHPNADSLYVSTIAVGDPAGADNTAEYDGQVVRTVCSGLNGLVPLADMQGRKVVAVCNLKPVTMRGVKSCAMVLAASPRPAPAEADSAHAKEKVELVDPPAGAEAGTRVYFEGWEGEPEGLLNPKKKVWESCQIGFTTTEDLSISFNRLQVDQLKGEEDRPRMAKLLVKGSGPCTVKSLRGAAVR